jgi:acyl-CoA reductase-like NAD-dependent aldehyde dehydrogenase
MIAKTAGSQEIVCQNPATGEAIARQPMTDPGTIAGLVGNFRANAQNFALERRLDALRRWHAVLSRDSDSWVDLIRTEIGKPRVEAMIEVVTTLDALSWTIRHARRALRDERIGPGWQRFLLMHPARVSWRPVGVIGMIGTWNYPLLLNAVPIAQALAAGNLVVWKPSELATASGRRIHDSLSEAGLVPDRILTVYGAAEVGKALVQAKLDKAVFTGGIAAGRAVLSTLGARGIPAIAELSGFDPAIVLPDASPSATAKSLTWSAFVGAGQTCVAVKRVYVLENEDQWASLLSENAEALRVGDPDKEAIDMGPLISRPALERFQSAIERSVVAGARILSGGRVLSRRGYFHEPTVLAADNACAEQTLAGVFGPVILLRKVPNLAAAIQAANAGDFGLAASVWGRNRSQLKAVASQLEAGMVTINDAVTPAGHASAPFGGVKASGFGRTHGVHGLREFAYARALHSSGHAGWRPQVFPYTPHLMKLLSVYRSLFHRVRNR